MTVCTECGYTHDPVDDGNFLVLNPEALGMSAPSYTSSAPELAFCSTKCLTAFIARSENMDRIAWNDPAKLPGLNPELTAFLKKTRALPKEEREAIRNDPERSKEVWLTETAVMMHRLGRRGPGCNRCAPKDSDLPWPSEARPGPFLYIEGGEARRREHALRGTYCSIACCIAFLNDHPYDARGWWTRPERTYCAHCGAVYRNDFHDESFIDLVLVEGMVSYCSSACLLAGLETMPPDKIRWTAFKDAVGGYNRGCMTCGCGEDAFENNDPDVVRMFEEADRLRTEHRAILERTAVSDASCTIIVSPTLDLDEPLPLRRFVETEETKAMASRAEELHEAALALIHERNPVFSKPFLRLIGGYGPPIDPDGIFCSVECVKALFGSEDWRDYDAKGQVKPRPTR